MLGDLTIDVVVVVLCVSEAVLGVVHVSLKFREPADIYC